MEHASVSQVLQYATPEMRRAVPEWDSAAEAMIDQGASVGEMRHLFASTQITANYVARSHARRARRILKSTTTCVACGAPATRRVRCWWIATAAGPWYGYRRFESSASCRFATTHRCCSACAERFNQIVRANRRLSLTAIIFAFVATPFAILGASVFGSRTFSEAAATALPMVALLLVIASRFHRVLRPNWTRGMMNRGVQWRGWILK